MAQIKEFPKRCRSLLFAAADDVGQLEEAVRTQADAVVADLEDGVAESRKDAAREVLANFLAVTRSDGAVFVRINSPDTIHAARDIELVAALCPDAIVVPKATPQTIATLDELRLPLVAVVETAGGLRCAYEIASSPPVAALALGANDLTTALGLESRADGQELLYARSKIVADSAAAGVRGPFDRVYPFDDRIGLETDARFARSLGFRGKSALRPGQAEVINDVFGATAPTTDES